MADNFRQYIVSMLPLAHVSLRSEMCSRILLLLSDVMVHCVASTFEVDLPIRSEMHMAVDVACAVLLAA